MILMHMTWHCGYTIATMGGCIYSSRNASASPAGFPGEASLSNNQLQWSLEVGVLEQICSELDTARYRHSAQNFTILGVYNPRDARARGVATPDYAKGEQGAL